MHDRAVEQDVGTGDVLALAFAAGEGVALEIAVEHDMHCADARGRGERVGDRLAVSDLSTGGVGGVDAVCPIAAGAQTVERGRHRCGQAGLGDLAAEVWEKGIVVHQRMLKLGNMIEIDAVGRGSVFCGYGGGSAYRLTEQGAGRHNADTAHGDMCHADISACEKEVLNVGGIERAVRQTVGRGSLEVGIRRAAVVIACRIMVVKRPAAKGNGVGEYDLGGYVALCHHVLAVHSARLALCGELTEEFKLPAVGVVPAAVLYVIPRTEGEGNELILSILGAVYGVLHTAKLKIPEVLRGVVNVHRAVLDVRVGEARDALRGGEFYAPIGLATLYQAAHTHNEIVGAVAVGLLAVFLGALAAVGEFRAGKRRENAIARAVGKVARPDDNKALRRHAIALDREDAAVTSAREIALLHLCVKAGGVEKQGNILLALHEIDEYRIPYIKILRRVAVEIFQHYLLDNARLAVVPALCAANPHTVLRRGVAAEHRTLLHQNDPRTVPRRGYRRVDACHTAANDAQICINNFGF